MQDLDLKDRKILYELDVNSRQSLSSISKKVGLSKEVVNYRIKTMEEKKVIDGYYTLINTSKLGFYAIRVYFKFQNSFEDLEQEMIKYLVDIKESVWVARTTGSEIDVATGIWAKDLNEFYIIWNSFEKKYRQYITNKHIAIFIDFQQFDRSYFINKKKETTSKKIIMPTKEEKIDNRDYRILQLIADNPRISLIDIGKKVDQTPNAVKYRIKQLEKKKIISGYSAKINLNKLNYLHYKVDISLNDVTKISALNAIIALHPNVIYYERTLGGSDFEFDLEVESQEQFREIIRQIKIELKGAIKYYTYYISRTIYKTVYLPSLT